MVVQRFKNSIVKTIALILQIFILLVIGGLAWKFIHHTPVVPSHVYPYLTGILPDIVLESHHEGVNLSVTGWADLLAVKSTLEKQQASPIIQQLKQGVVFDKINWELADTSPETAREVKERRKILLDYPLYEPLRYAFPVQGQSWYEDSWGAKREGGKRLHEGTDLFAEEGTPLFSVCAGEIEKLGWNRLGGERVGIRGEDGNYYYYAHLKEIESSLKIGQLITKGAFIGTMGHTGDALTTPDHLHFGIQLRDGTWINPYPFLSVWQHYPTEFNRSSDLPKG